MRHRNKINHLGRTHTHHKALMRNLSIALIKHKRINTTVPKAKELRQFIEPIITLTKNDTTANRRLAFSKLQNKEAVKILFDEIAEMVADRPGGYTRILKTGYRVGDGAHMCIIELVDFNPEYSQARSTKAATKPKTRRGGGRGKKVSQQPDIKEDTKAETKPITESEIEFDKEDAKAEADVKEDTKAKTKPVKESEIEIESDKEDAKAEPDIKEDTKAKTKPAAESEIESDKEDAKAEPDIKEDTKADDNKSDN